MEWNGGGGRRGVRGNLWGGGWRDSQHSFRLEPVTNGTLEILHVKVGWVQRVLQDRATEWETLFTGRTVTAIRPF